MNQENRDLVWDLDAITHRQRAAEFVSRFENKICVYSGSVEQLYTSYQFYYPKDESRSLVVLPDPYAHHDTFQGVSEDAVRMTGLNIIPGEMVGRRGLFLTIPYKDKRAPNQKARMKLVPLQTGLAAIGRQQSTENPFLPIVMKGDLRELEHRSPCLHLHCIQLNKLPHRSQMERSGMSKVIQEKLPYIR